MDGCVENGIRPDYEKTSDQVAQDSASFILFQQVMDLSDYGLPTLSLSMLFDVVDRFFEWFFDWALKTRREDLLLRLVGVENVSSIPRIKSNAMLCYFAGRMPQIRKDPENPPGLRPPLDLTSRPIKSLESRMPILLRQQRERDDLIFEWVLSHRDVDVNVADDLGNTPLHKAIQNVQSCRLALLLTREDVILNKPNLEGLSPLGEAVRLESEWAVELLLSHKGVDVNHTGVVASSPIARAICLGTSVVLKLLLNRRDIDPNSGGYRPLLEATKLAVKQAGPDSILRQLLGCDLVKPDELQDGHAALMLALQRGHKTVVAQLRRHNAIEKAYIRQSRLPFQPAIASGDVSAASKVLDIDNGLVNLCFPWKNTFRLPDGDEGKTTSAALWFAVYTRDEKMVKMLLSAGAHVEDMDSTWQSTPLIVASMNGDAAMAGLLLRHGASLCSEAMTWTITGGHHRMASFLLGEIDYRGQVLDLYLPLMAAIRLSQIWMVGLLLEKGATIEAPRAAMLLIVAVAQNDKEMVEFLLNRGADITAQDTQGRTACWWAAHSRAYRGAFVYPAMSGGRKRKRDYIVVDEKGTTHVFI